MDLKESIQNEITDKLSEAFWLDNQLYVELPSQKPIRVEIINCKKYLDEGMADNAEPADDKRQVGELLMTLFRAKCFWHSKELYVGYRSAITNEDRQAHIKFVAPRIPVSRPITITDNGQDLIEKAKRYQVSEEDKKNCLALLNNPPDIHEQYEPNKPWSLLLVERFYYNHREGNRIEMTFTHTLDSFYITEPGEKWWMPARIINLDVADYIHLLLNYGAAIDKNLKPHWELPRQLEYKAAFGRFLSGLYRQNHIHLNVKVEEN